MDPYLPPEAALMFRQAQVNVSTKYKFMFVHIPKNAGLSIAQVGKQFEGDGHVGIFDRPYWGHTRAEFSKENLPCHVWEKYFKFAVIRNPWDRLASLWGYFSGMKHGHQFYQGPNIEISEKFKELGSFKRMVLSFDKLRLFSNVHFLPQSYWVLDKGGKPLLDQYLRYENLAKDWSGLSKRLELPENLWTLPHNNKSIHLPYRKMYDRATRRAVGKLYRQDIHNFRYLF